MDLIDRQAAIDALVTPRVHDVYDSYWNGRNKQHQEDIDAINALPSAQPERKKGKWIFIREEEGGNALYSCSVCGKGEVHVPIVQVSYCWNCGADMRGKS